MQHRTHLLSFAFFFLSVVTANAQFEVGSITGAVTDISGARLPAATVEATQNSTNSSRKTTTSATGEYTFVGLQPGVYTIKVTLSGFSDQIRSVNVAVSERVEANVSLNVGSATATVDVDATSTAVNLETGSSELGNVRSQDQVQGLPLNSRNFTQLVYLAPGVNNRGNSANSVSQGYTNGRGTNGAVIGGNPPEDTVYLLDGIQSMDNDADDLILFPVVDAIGEFKVQTSAAPAAFGGSPAIINVSFRSGTSKLHGTLYEFVRNNIFDAKNYFDSPTKPIPPFHMNQFGANLSGPIVIPHLFNGRDKLFFFIDYEGKRQNQAQTYTSTVPTAAFRAGDFGALCTAGFNAAGLCMAPAAQLAAQQIYVPGTAASTGAAKIPLPFNRLTSIDPTSANLAALYPAPTSPGISNNFLFNGPVINNIHQGDARIDYHSNMTTIFGRFSKENPYTITPGYLPAPAVGGGPSRPGATEIPAWQGVLGYSRTFGGNKFYEGRLGYSRMTELIIDTDSTMGNLAEQLGIPNANRSGTGLTNISISGGTVGLGDGSGSLQKVNNNWEVDQAFTLIKGNHELKVGVDFQSRRFAFFSPTYPVGQMTFSGVYTGNGFADFLSGRPISSTLDVNQFFSLLRFQTSYYVQDNWRVSPKLTFNFGLRDDTVTPWTERSNRLAGFSPLNGGQLIPVGTDPAFPGNHITDGRYTNFGPRFGFSCSINSRTVLRGGVGIFYAFQNNTSNVNQAVNAPFHGSLVANNNSGNYAAAAPISAGFPAARPTLYPTAGTNFVYYPRSYKNPSANEWNLNLQTQLTKKDVLSIAYVGQTGVHVLVVNNINLASPGSGAVAARRPFPNLADGTQNNPTGSSSYHSFQASYIYTASKGLHLQGAYTYSHSLDNTSGTGSSVAYQNPYVLSSYYGNSDFDLRHSLVLSQTYELPFGRGHTFLPDAGLLTDLLVGGWQLNSIDTFQTGSPYTPTMATSNLNNGTGVQYPNRIGSGKLANRNPLAWFNTADFVAPPAFTFGNSGRNILYGPGTKQFDVSIFKTVHLNESATHYLQFRAEAFNVFNIPQFNNPNAQIGGVNAGKISSAGQPVLFQRTSREIQLAAKLYF
ncbi:carboxypeptidase-like regulatory domain-containing protein [Granulicella sp. dw_53]|uniref:carboxypeptidase-like regulatory domain-containing protein n=1 Tax=Granulicella sp. dw_53 TaxID=2719792 RepID=UPI001BD2F715|nr:carboxypeptidase-like regulatory domain-containing protein [Granulicella sp. dw_53]